MPQLIFYHPLSISVLSRAVRNGIVGLVERGGGTNEEEVNTPTSLHPLTVFHYPPWFSSPGLKAVVVQCSAGIGVFFTQATPGRGYLDC